MKLMNFCKLLFAVLLFLFATLELFFRHSFTTFLFAEEQDKKRYFTCWLCDSKLKWKFDICDSWLVTFLVREPCQRAPCTTVHNWQHNTMPSQESWRRLTLTPSLKPRSTTTFNKIPKPNFAKYRQTVDTMWKLTAKEIRFEWSHRPQAGFIYRDQAQDYIIIWRRVFYWELNHS